MRNATLTFGFNRRSSRPASLRIIGISQVYALLSSHPVASSFPSIENDAHRTRFECWSGEAMGWPFSRFHNRAVWSKDALARMRPFGDIAMSQTKLVFPVKTLICCQVVVFHVLIEESVDPDISVVPSAVQARQATTSLCALRFATSLPVFASKILMYP